MKNDGLKLTDLKGTFTVPVNALHISEVSGIREPFDIVFLSVKSYDTRWSTYLIEPVLKNGGFILPAQNGLNDELVAGIVGFRRTVGCVPTISAGVYDPGHVIRTDPMITHCFTVGELSGLITPRVREVVNELSVIGPSEATTNIWGARWAKMVTNCMGNALSGLMGSDLSALTNEQSDVAGMVRATTGCEVVRVAQGVGVAVDSINGIPAQVFAESTNRDAINALKDRLEAVSVQRKLSIEQVRNLGVPGHPSLLQDVIKGRRTEVDELNGCVVKKGRDVGVSTPMNQAIVDMMRALERGEIKPSPSNVEYLRPYLPS